MFVILITISIKSVEQRITKRTFLAILYSITLITIFSRHVFSFTLRHFLPDSSPALFRWDAIFFLIIPLVFIAWQFSLKHVIIYCLVVMIADFAPMLFEQNRNLVIVTNIVSSKIGIVSQQRMDIFFVVADFLGSFARSVILGIVGWIENRLVTLQRTQHDQLVIANKKLKKYALTSEKLAQTQERNRLARELHDTLAHTLSSTSVQLEATKALFDRDPDQAKAMLTQTLINTKHGLTETRRALVDLRSSELEAYGLTQAIKNLVNSASERGGFTPEFHLDKGMDVLPDEITHCIYRIVQEAVENVLRHANASHAIISLLAESSQIKLTISDNGNGFNPDKTKKEQLGIRGMRERVEMLGGKFNIVSDLKKGTEITIYLESNYD